MNLPYTMAPAKAAECAAAFKPRLMYPYHYRAQGTAVFASALRGTGIEVRLRDWYVGAKTVARGEVIGFARGTRGR